jgi:glycosyltransferase involved in cell wall biosynthesis
LADGNPATSIINEHPINILYLHHVGVFGGASRSLLEMLRSLPPGAVKTHAVLQRGAFADMLEQQGVEVERSRGMTQFDNHRLSYYRGWRWLILLREIAFLPYTWAALTRAHKRWSQIDLIHANEISLLPTLCLARRLWNKPAIVHVRSVQRQEDGWRDRSFYRLLLRQAVKVVAIDENVYRSLPASLHAVVVHNGFHPPERLGVPKTPNHAPSDRPFTVAMIGNLLRVKGCIEFVQAAAILKQRGLEVKFVFVGASVHPPHGIKQALMRLFGFSQEIEQEIESIIK